MPQFRVRVLIQCAEPGVTPDVDNAAVTLPRRMLCEMPRELAALLAASGVQTVAGPGSDAELALLAAQKVLADGAFDALPTSYTHREVAGSYLVSGGGSTVFVLARRGTSVAWTTRQVSVVPSSAADGDGRMVEIPFEFRCHLLVERMG